MEHDVTSLVDGGTKLVLGKIGAPVGLAGFFRVQSFAEEAVSLLDYAQWYIQFKDGWHPYTLAEGKVQKNELLAKLEGVSDRDAVQLLTNRRVAVDVAALPALEAGQYYWHQLEGLKVYNGAVCLGSVDFLYNSTAGAIMVITPLEGKERLHIPFAPDVVENVDLAEQRIDIVWQVI